MNWTEQQQAIFSLGQNGSGSFNVIARAGTAKTTTGVELSNRIKGRTLLVAYNKSIADELASRITGNPSATAATTHSVGFSLWRKIKPTTELDTYKVRSLAKSLHPGDKPMCDVLTNTVSLAKQAGFGIPGLPHWEESSAWDELMEGHDLWDEVPDGISPERVTENCTDIYSRSIEMAKDEGRIDFDDMLLLPLLLSPEKKGLYDWVIGDEAQDLSEIRRRMILHVVKDGGRVVGLGDPRQAIYQWAGASHDSMELLKKATGAVELPLTVTFRCPKLIVEMAQQWVPDYEAYSENIDGVIRNVHHTDFWFEDFQPNDVILCRNTRPLVGVAKRLRDRGIPCVVEGQNGKALIALATKWGDVDISELRKCLAHYRDVQVEKWLAKGREDKVEWVQEKVGILLNMAEGMEGPVRKLVQHLESMFGFGAQGARKDVLRLCTIHRAKGREWGRVFLVGRNRYQPSKWAKNPQDLLSEQNLEYVAVTRTKRELVEVKVPMPPRRNGYGSDYVAEEDWWEMGL